MLPMETNQQLVLYAMLGICLHSLYATRQNVMVGVGPVCIAHKVDRTLVMPQT